MHSTLDQGGALSAAVPVSARQQLSCRWISQHWPELAQSRLMLRFRCTQHKLALLTWHEGQLTVLMQHHDHEQLCPSWVSLQLQSYT